MALWKLPGKKPGTWSTFTGKLNRVYNVYYGVVRTDDQLEPQSSQVIRENHGAVPYDPKIHGAIPQVVRQLDPLEAAVQGRAAQEVVHSQERIEAAQRGTFPEKARGSLPSQEMSLDQLEAAAMAGDGTIPTRPAVTVAEEQT